MNYEALKAAELHHYAVVDRGSFEPENLPSALDVWNDCWGPIFKAGGFNGNLFIEKFREKCLATSSVVHGISLGVGSATAEIEIAEALLREGITNFHLECLEFNPALCAEVQQFFAQRNLTQYLSIQESDVNYWVATREYDIVMANWALHHFVELEHLFDQIYNCLKDDGLFLNADSIGRNGHARWPEAWDIVLPVWRSIPDRFKYNNQLGTWDIDAPWDVDCSQGSFEGIRAQDILHLLVERFHFHQFSPYSNLGEKFYERNYGPNYDPADPEAVAIIRNVAALDELLIDMGVLKPVRMNAVMGKQPVANPKYYKHWTPEFCIRWPDGLKPEGERGLTSIAMVVQNGLPETLACIEGLLSNTPSPVQIVVVDNGSTDQTSAALQQIANVVELVINPYPVPIEQAWQQALGQTRGDVVAFVSNDVRVHDGWFAPLLDRARKEKGVILSPLLRTSFGGSNSTNGFQSLTGVCAVGNAAIKQQNEVQGVLVPEVTVEVVTQDVQRVPS